MTDLGRPSLAWNSQSLMRHIQQWRYAEYLISIAHFADSWIADTPFELNVKYWINDGKPLPNPTLHLHLMGGLIYLTMTIPDTAHAIQTISQFVSIPHKSYLSVVHLILWHLTDIIDKKLLYSSPHPLNLSTYANSNCANTWHSMMQALGIRACMGSARSTMGAEACVQRHNKSPHRR